MNGGYYKLDLSNDLSYIGLNTIYFNSRNEEDLVEASN